MLIVPEIQFIDIRIATPTGPKSWWEAWASRSLLVFFLRFYRFAYVKFRHLSHIAFFVSLRFNAQLLVRLGYNQTDQL